MTIGPTFAAELEAAGITDWRFTWSADGRIEYHPEVPPEERKKVEAVLEAHDGSLSQARHDAMEAVDAEASKRIAEMFSKPPESLKLAYAEINRMAGVLDGVIEIIKKAGLASVEEIAGFRAQKEIWATVQAIRDTEGKAKAGVLAAKTPVEVMAVEVAWPAVSLTPPPAASRMS